MDFRGITEFFKDTSKYIIVIVVVLLTFIFILGIQQVVGPSMSPNYEEGNVLLVNKFIYRISNVKRNDVIVLTHGDKYMIKRVIGLPGEKVEYRNNNLYINGNLIEEKYIDKEKIRTKDFSLDNPIPDNMYFVLGDNREDSSDSREYGLISKKDIVGKSFVRIWPFNKFGIVK